MSFRATHNQIAVSANTRETAMNTKQTVDTGMLVSLKDVIALKPRRENNASEAIGKEEPDTIYDLGATVEAAFDFEKAQPQHFAFLCAYALGAVTTAAQGDGYKHTITPIADDLDNDMSNPSFTAKQRLGKTVAIELFASLFVDSLTATFKADDWVKLSGKILGTGYKETNVVEESITAKDDATSITLAAKAVKGSTAAERLQNVQRIRVELASGVWTEVGYSAVSAATPAVITIAAPGSGTVDVTYKVLYLDTTLDTAFPARVTETPLRISQMTMNLGGKWNGSAFAGGRAITGEFKQLDWEFKNNLKVQFVPGAGDAYASRSLRDGRGQTLKFNREYRDNILQAYIDANEYFGARVLLEGALYDDTYKYSVELIFPKLGIISSPRSVDGKIMAEAGELIVLEDDTYGSVIINVCNLVATYAA